MRIGIVTTWFERGASYVSKGLADALSTEHEVFIYARGGEEYAQNDSTWSLPNVTWGRRTRLSVPTPIHMPDFKKWLMEKKIEVVIFNEQHWWPPVFLCLKLGVRVGTYVDYYTEETIPFFGCYDFLICTTRRHWEVFGWHPQARYVPWGTDLELFRPQTHEKELDDPLVFFHSAGMSPQRKGTDEVIQAFSRIEGNARLIIHSQVSTRGALPGLVPLIDQMIALGRMELIERTVSAPGLYHLGDVYVYPSRLDGLGLTITEALACGLPVIATDAAPMNEFIDSSVGRLVKVSKTYARSDGYYWPQTECDIEDLAYQMASYTEDPQIVNDQRVMARCRAEALYDWSLNGKELLRTIDTCHRLSASEKGEAIQKALAFESERMGRRPFIGSLVTWLARTDMGHL